MDCSSTLVQVNAVQAVSNKPVDTGTTEGARNIDADCIGIAISAAGNAALVNIDTNESFTELFFTVPNVALAQVSPFSVAAGRLSRTVIEA